MTLSYDTVKGAAFGVVAEICALSNNSAPPRFHDPQSWDEIVVTCKIKGRWRHETADLATRRRGIRGAGSTGPAYIVAGRTTNIIKGYEMVKFGFLATLVAKPGQADALAAFLSGALPLAEAEDGTVTWYAFQIDGSTYGIFDTFDTPEARQAHIDGPIAAALMAHADELLAEPPSIKPIDVLAAK